MSELVRKFEKLYKKVSTKSFLNKEALGGEIPFFISPYNTEHELEVVKSIELLRKKLESNGIPVLELNLYDISCEIIDEEIGMDEFFEIEKDMDKSEFLDAIQSVLEIHQVLMPRISQKIIESDAKVYFLTGVGMVFPFIRSHNILNNQNIAKEAPTLCFFPGDYDGHSLELFGILKDDNYYRAFNIDKIEA